MGSNGINLVSYDKFDEALNTINSLSSCGITSAITGLKNCGALPNTYSEITGKISDIQSELGKLADGGGPEALIQNYKDGYNGIKNGIIDAYISEYKFALENGLITLSAESLRNLGAAGEEKVKATINTFLDSMSEKNKNLEYSSLTEFFKELQDMASKHSLVSNAGEYVDVFGDNIEYNEGYEDQTDVMPYTYLKPTNTDGKSKPLIVWLHGGGARHVNSYSGSNYNLTHVISESGLKNFDAYVISPVLTGSSEVWYSQNSVDKLSKLLDKFIAENNVDRNNIVICGGSAGGQGTLYMAKNMSNYFSQAVVLSGYGVNGINGQDIEIPIKGYVGKWDDGKSISYMKRLASEIGEDKVTYVSEATHGKLPRMLYNLDSDGNGKSDFIEDLFGSSSLKQSVVELKGMEAIYEKLKPNTYTSDNLQPKNNRDIAHRGYTPGGIYDNSAEGFRLAGEKGFWGCETDVRFDANGNLVCSHNAVQKGQNPTTFSEYLQICKDYGMTAIIDLKYANGPNKFDENLSKNILETIEKMGMMDSCVLQTNNPTDVPYIRENADDARIWYLTDVVSDSNIEMIKENGVECVNIRNSDLTTNSNRINKLTNNGIDVCVWNVMSETGKKNALNAGAKYVMSDDVLGITPFKVGDNNYNDSDVDTFKDDVIEDTSKVHTLEHTVPNNNGNKGNNGNTGINTDIKGTNPMEYHLTAKMGFNKNGPSGDETWYDLDMNNVVDNMGEYYGYTDLKASIRSDGVKLLSGTAPDGTTFSDLIMVAADVRHDSANPNGTYERGQIVDTSLGKGIVVDFCELAMIKRKNNKGNHFDIATAWWTPPYSAKAYAEETPLSNATADVKNLGNNDVGQTSGEDTTVTTNTQNTPSNTRPSQNSSATTLSNGGQTASSNKVTNTTTQKAPSYTRPSQSSSSTTLSSGVQATTNNKVTNTTAQTTPSYTRPSQSSSSTSPSSSVQATTNNKVTNTTAQTTPSYTRPSQSSSSTSPSSSVQTTPSNIVTNILPNNSFSGALPQLTSGNLSFLEIGEDSVSYEICNVSNNTYSDYVKALINHGYTMLDNGKFINENYEVITNITKDGKMSIVLSQINKKGI